MSTEPKAPESDGSEATTVYCCWCGMHASPPPATWSLITMPDRGPQLLCESCTRTNLRSIESQLPTDWW